jgi:hypothetical protein
MPDGLKHAGRKVTRLKQIKYSSYTKWQTVHVETWNDVSWLNLSYGRLQFTILYNEQNLTHIKINKNNINKKK